MNSVNVDQTTIELALGDITKLDVDAIVNAANTTLLGGGGVDGAIHRAAGPRLLDECRAIIAGIGKLPTGQAVTTGGGALKARHVIHTVGPVWSGGNRREEDLLRAAYDNSLAEADKHAFVSIAFPSISTGAYRFPLKDASAIALESVIDYLADHPQTTLRRIVFVLFSTEAFDLYATMLDEVGSA